MATPQAYAIADILERIRLRVVDATGLDDSFVRLVANDDYQVSHEETLVAIRPLGPTPMTDAGGGRRARPFRRYIRVYVHKRSSVDRIGDDRLLIPQLCAVEDQIYDYLDDWFPRDTDGNVLTIEPLHPVDASAGPPLRKASDDIGECWSRVDFEVNYLQVNSSPIPD